MSEHYPSQPCCNEMFKCGDLITVRFIIGDEEEFSGIYISSTSNRLIWRNTTLENNPLECTSCSIISISSRRTTQESLSNSTFVDQKETIEIEDEVSATPALLPPPLVENKPITELSEPNLLRRLFKFFFRH